MRYKRISKGLRLAIKRAGSVGQLARLLGIQAQSINNWKRVPRHRIMAVEAATGVPKELLAPDLFGT